MPARFAQLRIPRIPLLDKRLDDTLLLKFADATVAFAKSVSIAGAEFLDAKKIIFEGAQGLLLDQDNKDWFPHVTRSNTGLTNIIPIANVLNLALDVVYVTRTYLTRHGAGPLPGEDETSFAHVIDETNVKHPYQGLFRFASLDLGAMCVRIMQDMTLAPAGSKLSVAATWLDFATKSDWSPITFDLRYTSAGPRRDQIEER
jgi:adenylosuccinate synthase